MPEDHGLTQVDIGTLEDWHEVDTTGEPGFENSWVNYDPSMLKNKQEVSK